MSRLPRHIQIPCRSCNVESRHKIIHSVNGGFLEIEQQDVYYQIAKCLSCNSHSFRRYFRSRDRSGGFADVEELFPSRRPGIRQLDFRDFPIPISIMGIYIETSSAVVDGFGTLAALGIRTVIEGVCDHQGAKGRSLDKKIDSLAEIGCLNKRQAESLHTLRNVGNAAAHEAANLDPDQIELAWESLDMILRCSYSSPRINRRLLKKPDA